jgi:stage II sporulation protein D
MRLILPISLAVLLLALLLPLLLVSGPAPAPEASAVTEREKELVRENGAAEAPYTLSDEQLMLRVLLGDEVHEMSMAALLTGVVAAEMPARFHPEALAAQAVAARTYALHRMLVEPSPRHPQADVCGSYACCKAFHSPERLRERWGAGFERYSRVIADAVRATDGLILLFEGEPILAAFHAASYGYTEASGAIWGSLPYLQSVRSYESAEEVPRLHETVTMTFSEFREIALGGIPGAWLPYDDIPHWIGELRHTDAGRLASLQIGGVTVTGPEFRRLFGLRSTQLRFAFDAEGLSLTTGGHGHGVGMSQFGANTMAHRGLDFAAILDWYYTGVTLARMDEVLDARAA